MDALKKAYAEIILNMAKEVAVRVMASEQKALKFQQDLHSTKEEALRVLLRLKLMIDLKTTEAERLSKNQQRRIDELEAQLNEAEGLIIDLRGELLNVREQLNGAKNKHLHHPRPHEKKDLVCWDSSMANSKLNNLESFKFPTELGSNVCSSTDMSDTTLRNYSKVNHILDLENVKSSEPEIYQNGRCATEMSLAGERLHSGDEPSFPVKVKLVTGPPGQDAGAHITASSKTKKTKNSAEEEPLKGHACKPRPYTFRGKRRRKTRYGKTKNSSCMVRCNKHMLSQRPLPVSSRSARYLHTGTYKDSPDNPSTNTEKKNGAGSTVVSGKKDPQNKDLTVAVSRRSLRKRRLKYLDEVFLASFSHSSHSNQTMRPDQQCPSFSPSKSNAVESTKLGGEGDVKEAAGFDNNVCGKSKCADNDGHEDKLVEVSVMVEEGNDNQLINLDMLPVEPILGDAKISEESEKLPFQDNNKKLLKYTFSRKRKKDSLLNPNENPSPENSLKKRSAEIENIDPRLRDSKLAKDSPLRSKQLVQVARQLISLSGRSF